MNPGITNFLLLVISSHRSRIGALKARQWGCPRFPSAVCVLSLPRARAHQFIPVYLQIIYAGFPLPHSTRTNEVRPYVSDEYLCCRFGMPAHMVPASFRPRDDVRHEYSHSLAKRAWSRSWRRKLKLERNSYELCSFTHCNVLFCTFLFRQPEPVSLSLSFFLSLSPPSLSVSLSLPSLSLSPLPRSLSLYLSLSL
jgi:hypothetical protein